MIDVQPAYAPLYENEDKFITLITGGRGSAKSFNASAFLERLSFEAGHKILFCRYTMSSASLSVIPEFNEKVELEGTESFFNVTKTDILNKFSGSVILFRGIRTSSGNQTAKLKSIQGITTFVCDEAEEWVSEEDFDKIVLSIRKKGMQLRVIIIMNPSDVNHFIYQKYIKDTHKVIKVDGVDVQISTHPNVLHIHTTYFDNINNLGDEFIKEVEELKQNAISSSKKSDGTIDQYKYNRSKYAHLIIGNWAETKEGVIFKNYEIVDEIPNWVEKKGIGMDFGFSNDPTAIIRCAVYKNDLYLDELCYKTHMLSKDIIKELRKSNDRVISESADPRLITEIRNGGVNIHPVVKFNGSIKAGINKMLEYNIKVTRRSANIKEELKNYTWDKDKDGNFINEPIDEWNHALDAARYWILKEILGKILKKKERKVSKGILAR